MGFICRARRLLERSHGGNGGEARRSQEAPSGQPSPSSASSSSSCLLSDEPPTPDGRRHMRVGAYIRNFFLVREPTNRSYRHLTRYEFGQRERQWKRGWEWEDDDYGLSLAPEESADFAQERAEGSGSGSAAHRDSRRSVRFCTPDGFIENRARPEHRIWNAARERHTDYRRASDDTVQHHFRKASLDLPIFVSDDTDCGKDHHANDRGHYNNHHHAYENETYEAYCRRGQLSGGRRGSGGEAHRPASVDQKFRTAARMDKLRRAVDDLQQFAELRAERRALQSGKDCTYADYDYDEKHDDYDYDEKHTDDHDDSGVHAPRPERVDAHGQTHSPIEGSHGAAVNTAESNTAPDTIQLLNGHAWSEGSSAAAASWPSSLSWSPMPSWSSRSWSWPSGSSQAKSSPTLPTSPCSPSSPSSPYLPLSHPLPLPLPAGLRVSARAGAWFASELAANLEAWAGSGALASALEMLGRHYAQMHADAVRGARRHHRRQQRRQLKGQDDKEEDRQRKDSQG